MSKHTSYEQTVTSEVFILSLPATVGDLLDFGDAVRERAKRTTKVEINHYPVTYDKDFNALRAEFEVSVKTTPYAR